MSGKVRATKPDQGSNTGPAARKVAKTTRQRPSPATSVSDEPKLENCPEAADVALGKRLKEIRQARSLRLTDMSEITGLTVSALSKVENGKLSLTFKTVVRLSINLGVPMASLLEAASTAELRGRRSVTRAETGYKSKLPHITLESLCDDLATKKNDFCKMTIHARSSDEYDRDWSTHPGEEFLLVLSGSMALHTDIYKPLILNAGDSIQFDSMTPHIYVATSEEPPVLLVALTLPEFHDEQNTK